MRILVWRHHVFAACIKLYDSLQVSSAAMAKKVFNIRTERVCLKLTLIAVLGICAFNYRLGDVLSTYIYSITACLSFARASGVKMGA